MISPPRRSCFTPTAGPTASRRAADRRRRAGVPRLGADAAGPIDRHRAGARAADHGGEARDQCRDGRLPADAFPGGRDRVGGDDEGRIPAARHHVEHRRLCGAGDHQRAGAARDRRQRDLQRARQQRPSDRLHRPRDPPRADQPDGRAAGRHRPNHARAIPASSPIASPRTRRTRPGSRSRRCAAFRRAPPRSP